MSKRFHAAHFLFWFLSCSVAILKHAKRAPDWNSGKNCCFVWDKQNLLFRRFPNKLAWQIPTQLEVATTATVKQVSSSRKNDVDVQNKQRRQTIVLLLEKPRKTLLKPVNTFSVCSIPSLQRRQYRLKQFDEYWGVENYRTSCCKENSSTAKIKDRMAEVVCSTEGPKSFGLETVSFLWWISLQIEERWKILGGA